MSRVLVVDDVTLNRDIARALLGGHGHDILEAGGAAEALAVVRATHPDVVVTDVLMPGMDGYELVREIRADPSTAQTPVVFYTANYLESEARPLADACGVTQVVLRTDDPGKLIEAVEAALIAEGHRAGRADLTRFDRDHLHTVNNKLITKVRDLHATEARFRIIADESPLGIVLTDTAAAALYVSPRVAELLHRPASEQMDRGNSWLTAYDADTRRSLIEAITGDGPGLRHRTCLTVSTEAPLWLDLIVRRVTDLHGEATGAVVMIDDVTDLVTADARARAESSRREEENRQRLTERLDALARMSGTVAHEFNNILAGSQAYLAFATEALNDAITDGRLDARMGHHIMHDLERSQHSGQRGAALGRQLLAFGRHEITHPSDVDLNDVVRSAAAEMTANLPANVELRLEAAPEPIRIHTDPQQLCQALRHLIINAVEAMPTGGTCTITCRAQALDDAEPGSATASQALITIQDTGSGMPPEAVVQAIDPFYTTKQRGQGTGLGLTTAYGIITQAGGHLSIRSTPGEGTLVDLRLPVTAARPATPPDRTHPAPATPASPTVLVVDDDEDVRIVVERILLRAGYLVVTAHDGKHALAVARSHPSAIDCLITDVMMPVMNGRELALEFGRGHPETPVIFISGYAAALIDERGMLEPGSTVITKPFTREVLLGAVKGRIEVTSTRSAGPV